MKRKKDLEKGIEDDLTRKEREIQNRLKSLAKEKRENEDTNVRVGYEKIYMNKRWYWWNEREKRLEEEKASRRE